MLCFFHRRRWESQVSPASRRPSILAFPPATCQGHVADAVAAFAGIYRQRPQAPGIICVSQFARLQKILNTAALPNMSSSCPKSTTAANLPCPTGSSRKDALTSFGLPIHSLSVSVAPVRDLYPHGDLFADIRLVCPCLLVDLPPARHCNQWALPAQSAVGRACS